MLTQNDLLQIAKLLKNERDAIKKLMREEIEAEAKPSRTEMKLLRFNVKGLENRLKDVEIVSSRIEEEIKNAREDIKVVDMKVELVNKKVDDLRGDTVGGFDQVLEAIEQNDVEYKKNIRKIKEFVGMTS